MSAIPSPASAPRALRLRWVEQPGRESLDGAWWPYSRDLTREIQDLSAGFPVERGRVARVVFSRPDWNAAPRRIDLGARILKVGSFPRDDTHTVIVQTGNRDSLTLLVVPPEFSIADAEAAMTAASAAGNSRSGTEVLGAVGGRGERWIRSEDGTPGALRVDG